MPLVYKEKVLKVIILVPRLFTKPKDKIRQSNEIKLVFLYIFCLIELYNSDIASLETSIPRHQVHKAVHSNGCKRS
jgi:hypothetical protein